MISPNVIITKKFDTMKRIFFGPKSLGESRATSLNNVLEEVKGNDALICAPGNNNTLLELDLNYPQKSDAYLNAKFVETKEILEYFAIDMGPLDLQFNRAMSLLEKANIPLGESADRLNRYYIAFGTGDDLSQWAGPFECGLGAAEMTLDNNVKSLQLGFVMGELGSIKSYTSKLYGNLGFHDEKLNPALPKGTTVRAEGSVHLNHGLDPLLGPLEMIGQGRSSRRKRCLLPPRGWNSYLRMLLRSYLARIYGDFTRIMVLLPDDFDPIFNADLVGSTSIDFFRNYQGKLREFGVKLKVRKPKNATGERAKSVSFKKTLGQGDDVQKVGPEFNVSEQDLSQIASRMGQFKFDLENYYDDYADFQGNPAALKEKASAYRDLLDRDFLLTDCFIEMESIFNVDPNLKTPQELLDPLFEFVGALRRYQGKYTNYALYELNDAEINNLINEATPRGKYPSFTSRIVFGDIDLIKKLIYLSDNGNTPVDQNNYGMTFAEIYLDQIDWESYQENFKNTILDREKIQNSSFKEKIDFGPFTPEFKEIKDVKDIIFLHGVTNSNVQSISFTNEPMQGAILDFNLRARRRTPFLNVAQRQAVINDTFKVKDVIDYLEDKRLFTENLTETKINLVEFLRNLSKEEEEELGKLEDQSSSRQISQGRAGTKEDLETYVDLIIGYKQTLDLVGEDFQSSLVADVPYENDSTTDNNRILKTYADLMEQAARNTAKIEIRTLPFFNQKYYMEKQCYFFSMYNNISRSINNKTSKIPTMFLNGAYKILSARHFMSGDDAFSEFTLTKDGPQQDPILEKSKQFLTDAASTHPERSKTGPSNVKFDQSGNSLNLPSDNKRQKIAEQLDKNLTTNPITPNPGGTRFPGSPSTN